MIRTIKFHRQLADTLKIDELTLDIDNSKMLILGLKSLVPGFKEYIKENPNVSVYLEGDESLKDIDIGMVTDYKETHTVHLVDAIEGEFAAAFFVGLGMSAFAAAVTAFVVNMALSMVISAIAQSLASKPSTNNGNNPANQTQSFIFNQPINVTSQGGAIPIAYGTVLVGSTVIAADIKTIDMAITTVPTVVAPPPVKPAPVTGAYIGLGGTQNANRTGIDMGGGVGFGAGR